MVDTAPPTLPWVCVATLAAATVGCNDVSSSEDLVPLEAFAYDETPGQFVPGVGLPGVEVCQVDTADGKLRTLDNCATTDEDGWALMWLPANESVAWTLTKDGYQSVMVADVTDGFYDPRTTWPLFTEESFADLCEDLRVEGVHCGYPLVGMGAVSVFTRNPSTPGAVFDIVGVADTPLYLDFAGVPDPALEETTGNGDALFWDVPPGDREIRFGGAAAGCTPRQSWPTDEPDLIVAPVRAGFHTYAGLGCATTQP